jgi:rhodanese-related sulfurtransferase/DNA-binding transcriptional ArsR family regulator
MIGHESSRRAATAHYGEIARLGKALASPVRLQLVDLLRQGPRGVEALAGAAHVSVANGSRHLQQLRAARLVEARRQGRRVEYRLTDAGVSAAFAMLRGLAEALLPEMDRLRRELRVLDAGQREAVLAALRAGRATLLDVRPVEEYRAGHLPRARSIPLAELPGRLAELPRSRPIIACCRGPYCHLAIDAVALLRAAGFRARHLDLGVPDLAPPAPPPGLARPTTTRSRKRMPR